MENEIDHYAQSEFEYCEWSIQSGHTKARRRWQAKFINSFFLSLFIMPFFVHFLFLYLRDRISECVKCILYIVCV